MTRWTVWVEKAIGTVPNGKAGQTGRPMQTARFFREDRGDVGVDAVRATFLVKQGACNRLQDLILPNSDVIGIITLIVFKF